MAREARHFCACNWRCPRLTPRQRRQGSRSTHVQEDTHRQSRRNCPSCHLRLQRARNPHGGDLQRGRPQLVAGPVSDEAICIGPPQLGQSYLNIPAVISAAEIANVDAIHPGYGLLAEHANFPAVSETCNIKFIGPPPEITRLMGEKEKARAAMKNAGVPILPGSEGILAGEGDALE